jgi:hypothetical protein
MWQKRYSVSVSVNVDVQISERDRPRENGSRKDVRGSRKKDFVFLSHNHSEEKLVRLGCGVGNSFPSQIIDRFSERPRVRWSTRFAASVYRNHTDTSPDAGERATGRFCLMLIGLVIQMMASDNDETYTPMARWRVRSEAGRTQSRNTFAARQFSMIGNRCRRMLTIRSTPSRC